ncbi:MAG: ABC transporter substrate-binding protein, partial [Oricola sp.]|nr:ABC transporter substrate-binding protein [Oricola sp.]
MSQFKKRLISSTSRRTVLKGLGVGVASLAMPNIARAQAGTIKIGYVTPATGPMALFGETDGYTVEKINALLADGLEVNGERYNVEILVQDSQSDSNRSAEVSGDLILNEEVNLLIPASTTPTITAAADQAELYEIPCVSCGAPWQAIIFPRGGADNPFTWTYHFFWGLDEALRTFVGLWNTIETNKKVGMLFPQNIDGETWGNEDYGLPSPT